ncbi:arginyl-tRNA synthetase [Tieghemostelium lacteum]|uniref:arginine--tRNA ligase n=1 Tax=Tieghemostelium lacteum TaxID=361077 RepID=A0A151ZAW4_TIELA|nr:arginyl-tRNA synthetase [Tieghemostelium lacteum]|eukprot:KYQ91087.1 arginyl-tRNA synthetase [Tieghemostelium lacteum]
MNKYIALLLLLSIVVVSSGSIKPTSDCECIFEDSIHRIMAFSKESCQERCKMVSSQVSPKCELDETCICSGKPTKCENVGKKKHTSHGGAFHGIQLSSASAGTGSAASSAGGPDDSSSVSFVSQRKTKLNHMINLFWKKLNSKSLSTCVYSKRYYSLNSGTGVSYQDSKRWFDVTSRSAYGMLNQCFDKLIEKSLPEQQNNVIKDKFKPTFSVASNAKFKFDYSLNNLVVASRLLGQSKPNEITLKLIETFNREKSKDKVQSDKEDSIPFLDLIEKIEGNEKGTLNIHLSDDYLKDALLLWTKQIQSHRFQNTDSTAVSKDILVDFASPNMSKELHVGHLRSIALGESICRILEYLGHNVERVSHVGDFGTPMGMVIAHAMDVKAPFLEDSSITPTPKELSILYSESKAKTKVDPVFAKRTLLTAAELQKGPPSLNGGSDPAIYHAWQRLCEVSRIGFNEIFNLMKVQAEERGESYYRTMLAPVIETLEAKGLVVDDQGAKCVFLPNLQKEPIIIRKSDGGYLYATTDLAAIKSRVESGKDWVIVITDDTQKQHFQAVWQIAQKAGWLPTDGSIRVDHLSFGVVKGENGLKLSSRDGTPTPLLDLIKESIERSKLATITSRSLTRSEKIDSSQNSFHSVESERLQEKFEIPLQDPDHYRKIGVGALKYYDLIHRNNPYIFSYDNILSFKGNTSIYILYSYTRISTILERSQIALNELLSKQTTLDITNNQSIHEFTEKERKIVFLISRFSDTLKNAENQLKPGIVCDYLYDLADSFHAFYETDRVIGSERETQRLLICLAIKRILSTGLHLLGVETVERI